MNLADSYREMSRFPEAIEVFEQSSQQLTRLGRDDTQTAGTLYNNWALALEMVGRTREAERIFKRAIDLSRDNQGEAAVSPMLLTNYARTLTTLARLGEAPDYTPSPPWSRGAPSRHKPGKIWPEHAPVSTGPSRSSKRR